MTVNGETLVVPATAYGASSTDAGAEVFHVVGTSSGYGILRLTAMSCCNVIGYCVSVSKGSNRRVRC
jgi:hypothetical protein